MNPGIQLQYDSRLMAQQLAQQAQSKAPSIPVLEAQVSRVHNHAEEIGAVADRLHAIADRLFGPAPADGPKNSTGAPSPSDSLGKLGEAHAHCDVNAARLREAVNRLEIL